MEGISYNKKSILEIHDTSPTANSTNTVTSGGVKTYVDNADAVLRGEISQVSSQISSPFNYKGVVAAVSNLPSSGNTVNDTYYVTAARCLYSWNGTAWSQSSMQTSDYDAVIAQMKADVATAYDATKTYKKDDIVMYNNQTYVAKQDIDTAEAFTSSHWTAMSLGDAITNVNNERLHAA